MIEDLRKRIIEANEAYRNGDAIISDMEFDALLDELTLLSPDDELLLKIGHNVTDDTRKMKLPIPMASMNKIKTIDEIKDWHRLKLIPSAVEVICTPKYDGLSLCVNEITCDAITRGDGTYGQKSTEHYRFIGNHLYDQREPEFQQNTNAFGCGPFAYTYGEVIMPKSVFLEKYATEFANPRNLVAGLINSKTISDPLKDCQYIKYGAVLHAIQQNLFTTKAELLDSLNNGQKTQVPYFVSPITELTEETLINLFHMWSQEFEIDGIIIEVNNLATQKTLGREATTGNPIYARAFKHESFEQKAESTVTGISWNISKQGLLKPILHIEPIRLDGVTVSNVTGNNARFVKDMGIGVGAKVVVKRSGMVIPKIIDVVKTVEFTEPTIEGVEIGWNDAGIELITLTETEDQQLKKIVAFFEILEADNVGEGVIKQLWDAGFTTIKSVLNATNVDFEKIEGFGKRKAKIVNDSIKKSTTNVQLSKIQHASGVFSGLGSKKLALLEHFTEKPTIDQVMEIEGFAEISAKTYVDNFDNFTEFIKGLPVTIEQKQEVVLEGTDLESNTFVFTGVRRKDLEDVIERRGGKIGSSVSKNTTHLVMKEKGSGSSKETKAISLGVEILTVEELEDLLR
jgi:NAD-dependent DNA ligase